MKIKTFFPLYVAAFLFLSSCDSSFSVFSGNQSEELLLELPSWPPNDDSQVPYPELSRWLIQIENTGSATCQAFSTNESFISNHTGQKRAGRNNRHTTYHEHARRKCLFYARRPYLSCRKRTAHLGRRLYGKLTSKTYKKPRGNWNEP